MAEEEHNKKRNELKIKKKDYTGLDDEEFTEGQAGMRRAILAKYDEDLEGAQETVRLSKDVMYSIHLILIYWLGFSFR